MVFYRKYRSQTIDELDSAAVREKLAAVLKKNTPHAFLFTGPKGLGKTSTARILAKAVNCTGKKAADIEPCNKCDQCLSITNGTNVDILEIDAASNRGIDEIRDLKEKIRLSPVAASKKVYIIDEVHMLTTEAFNALLKTLEEPPAHAMFILCTTEPQKVPSTILSRCFHIAFQLAKTEEIVRAFKRIIASEKVQVDDEALVMIAKLADGGFRDGVKMLEELVTLAQGKNITKEFIEEKYQVSSISYLVFSMIEAFQERNVKKGLEIVSQLAAQGIDMKHFLQKMIEALHADLLEQLESTKPFGKVHTEQSRSAQGKKLSIEEIKDLFVLLTQAYSEMKNTVLPQLPLELALLEWTSQDVIASIRPLPETRPRSAHMNVVSVTSLRKQVGTIKRLQVLYGDKAKKAPVEPEVSVTTTVDLMQTPGDGPVTAEWLDLFWKNLIHEMKKKNHTVAGLLRGCSIKSYANNQLIIETSYKFHKERLDDMKTREALLTICKLLTGNELQIGVQLRK